MGDPAARWLQLSLVVLVAPLVRLAPSFRHTHAVRVAPVVQSHLPVLSGQRRLVRQEHRLLQQVQPDQLGR